jgi:hypothetical protein
MTAAGMPSAGAWSLAPSNNGDNDAIRLVLFAKISSWEVVSC